MWNLTDQDGVYGMKLSFLTENLSRTLKPLVDEGGANAAVVILLKQDDEKLCVLFVKRVESPKDPWSGQIALPGGKRAAEDANLKETVIRETREETNINLLVNCRFLGVMEAFQSAPRPDIKVLPFVVLIEDTPPIKLSEKELEGYFWIPVNELVQNKAIAKFAFGEAPAFIMRGMVIWGLTYRIMKDLITRLGLDHRR